MTLEQLELNTIQWAGQRGIIANSSASVQLLKAVSELGELADATIKGERDKIVDGVGDVLVCLAIYCALQDVTLTDCFTAAYDEIKDRRGRLQPNGVFIKEADYV